MLTGPHRHVYCDVDWQGYEVEVTKETAAPAISFEFHSDLQKTLVYLDELDRMGDYLLNYICTGKKRMCLPFWTPREMFLRVFPGDCRNGNIYVRLANSRS